MQFYSKTSAKQIAKGLVRATAKEILIYVVVSVRWKLVFINKLWCGHEQLNTK